MGNGNDARPARGPQDVSAYMALWHRELESLSQRGVTLVGSFPEGGPLADQHLAAINSSALGDRGIQILGRAISGGVLKELSGPAVIDVDRAASAYAAVGTPYDNDWIRRSLLAGRIRLQGTDGVRGAVSLDRQGDPVLHFGRTGEITPELVETLCYAFGRMARRAGIARRLTRVAAAEDGRDAATGGALGRAMREGLQSAGLTVVDLGVAPTPVVPFAQAAGDIPLGVALTASHNPAAQNGVKFFIDGFKMTPEGPAGDYALSATAYVAACQGYRREAGRREDGRGIVSAFADYIVANLPEEARRTLSGLDIVLDCANGAFTSVGREVLSRLDLPATLVNDAPTGANINQGGGVAELEGRKEITADEASGSPALASVAAILERARAAARPVYGLVMDGDGDRGYVVVAQDGKRAFVVDGDAEALILARRMRADGTISDADAGRRLFVGTVESDLMLFRTVERELGLSTDVACVGDKWLVSGHRAGRPLAIGEEVSGHVLWPTAAEGPDGSPREVLTGNGLLTALSVVAAGVSQGLGAEGFARPFPEGAFVTRYTYNVNKALLFPGSHAWEEDLKAVGAALDAAKGEGFSTWSVVEKVDEPDMLYIGLFDADERRAGAVFVRNSGTENKAGVYARGEKSLEPLLERLCLLLWQKHRNVLKDRHAREYKIEAAVLDSLAKGPLSRAAVAVAVEASMREAVEDSELETVLYGMRKEGLVAFADGRLSRLVE